MVFLYRFDVDVTEWFKDRPLNAKKKGLTRKMYRRTTRVLFVEYISLQSWLIYASLYQKSGFNVAFCRLTVNKMPYSPTNTPHSNEKVFGFLAVCPVVRLMFKTSRRFYFQQF